MAKMPFMMFYPKDWLYDTRILTDSEKAVWIDLLCFMWNSPQRGVLTGPRQDLAQLVGKEWADFNVILDSLKRKKILEVTEANGEITLTCRRMIREENERESNRLRQRKFKKRKSNEEVTPKKAYIISHIPPIIPQRGMNGFSEFWSLYPKKQGKGAAEKSWRKMSPPKEEALSSLKKHIQSSQWQKDGGQYIPNPATWLNQKRWEDEISDPYEKLR